MNITLGIILILTGFGMAFFWISHIAAGNLKQGIKTVEGENYIVFHITAELLTAVICVAAGFGLALGCGWGKPMGLLACGMLAYTGINSLAWIKNVKAIKILFSAIFIISAVGGGYLLASYMG